MTEKELLDQVRELAKLYHVNTYHTHDSRRSEPGFPDIVLVGRRVEFWELKSAKGQLTQEQRIWAMRLMAAGMTVQVFRPADWDTMVERMRDISGR